MDWILALKLLLLLFAANSAPVIAAKVFGSRWSYPIDGGIRLRDGNPLFGTSKTWRGLCAAILLTAAVAWLLSLPVWFGLVFGLLAMLGDLLSSYTKRRLGKESSSQALLLDQLPEALLPLLIGQYLLEYGWPLLLIVSLTFVVSEMLASPVLFKLGIRKKPY